MSTGPFELCRPRFACKALAVLVLLASAGCAREEGESCQRTADCEDGLICANIASERGVCIRPEDVELDAGTMDSSMPDIVEPGGDAAVDAALDAAPSSDTGTPDAGSDAGPGDDGGSDDAGG